MDEVNSSGKNHKYIRSFKLTTRYLCFNPITAGIAESNYKKVYSFKCFFVIYVICSCDCGASKL